MLEEAKSILNSSVAQGSSLLNIEKPPYQDAIDKLKEIPQITSPMKKLHTIASINEIICKCVDDYWKGTTISIDKLSIDADQYLSILVYIVSKAHIPNLFSEISLAEELANLGSKLSYNKYCLTSLQACFCHLINLEIPDTANQENLRISIVHSPGRQSLINPKENETRILSYDSTENERDRVKSF